MDDIREPGEINNYNETNMSIHNNLKDEEDE